MTTLDQIVRSVLNAEGAQGLYGYDRYLMMAYECLQDLQISIIAETRTAVIPIAESDALTVGLPGDCIKLYKASLWTGQAGAGSFRRLHQRPPSDIRITGGVTRPAVQQDNDSSAMDVYLNFLNPSTGLLGALYAQYGETYESGTYVYDMQRQTLSVDSAYAQSFPFVVVMYKSRGDKSSQLVPEDCFMAIRAYIQWQKIWDQKSAQQGDKMMKRSEYYNQRRLLRNRRYGLTPDEFNEARRWSYGAGVKIPQGDAD